LDSDRSRRGRAGEVNPDYRRRGRAREKTSAALPQVRTGKRRTEHKTKSRGEEAGASGHFH
jgi:hypothetical protein